MDSNTISYLFLGLLGLIIVTFFGIICYNLFMIVKMTTKDHRINKRRANIKLVK